MKKRKHLIIGCGAAALSALKQMRKSGSSDEVKLVTMEHHKPYSPMSLPYLISGRRKESEVYVTENDFFEKMSATFDPGKRVKGINPRENMVIYDDDKTEPYDTVLIATGSEPVLQTVLRKADIPGFHVLDDYVRLRALKDKSKIAILGAGFVGMELAVAFSERGHNVTVIAPRERILRQYFDPEFDPFLIDLFRDHRISVHLNWGEVTKVDRSNGAVEASFQTGRKIEGDLLISATGVVPRLSFLNGSGIACNRGILVNRNMRTNIPNVFAAGDVAEAPSLLTGENGLSLIHPTAIDEGKVAGSSMIGEEAEYEGWLSMNTFNFFGHLAMSIGQFTPLKGDDVLVEKDALERKYVKIVCRDNRVIGINVFNTAVNGGSLGYLIRKRVDIGAHKELLLRKPKEASLWLVAQAEKEDTISLER